MLNQPVNASSLTTCPRLITAAGERAQEVFRACFDRGLLVRVTGDIIALSPSLIIEESQIDEITSMQPHEISDLVTKRLEEFPGVDRAYVHVEPHDWVD